MLNYFQFLANPPTTTAAAADLGAVTAPIISLLNSIFGIAIPLVGAIGAIFCIFLGLKLAKADEQQEREKAKSALKNAIIGFVLIFVLVVALRIGLPIMETWANSQST
ncbi:MAG: pilin [Oscillospiraceae bacterium]|nr:pilin [Oscillospiraceae bacterium]